MKYKKLFWKQDLLYTLANLDIQNLIRKSFTDPEAWQVLTDYLLETGQIKRPEIPSIWNDPERFSETVIQVTKANVTSWIINHMPPSLVKNSDLKPGDIVSVRNTFGENFKTIKKVERVDRTPSDLSPGISADSPWLEQFDRCVIEFVDGTSTEGPASLNRKAYQGIR